ncbi:MAG: hypothetical protein HYU99_11030 [Deltaproteobacteria bacterium]|nr:hypothetical protein [Deltaproteobacteria bacterium]
MVRMRCYFCHKPIEIKERVGRQERCPFCDRDLHICKNCEFYGVTAYNECREPQAERVVDKEKSNFCDYFVFAKRVYDGPADNPAAAAKKKLEALFKR